MKRAEVLQQFDDLVHFLRVSQKIIIAKLKSRYHQPEFVFVRKGNRSLNCPDTFVRGVFAFKEMKCGFDKTAALVFRALD